MANLKISFSLLLLGGIIKHFLEGIELYYHTLISKEAVLIYEIFTVRKTPLSALTIKHYR